MSSFVCHLCGAALDVSEPISRDAECPGCRTDVRCCRNCRHYDERYNNSCTETQADPVPEKTRRNFCEYFYFSREPFAATGGSAKRAADARSKLDMLFGGKGAGEAPPPGAKEKLDALFKTPPAEPRPDDARSRLGALFKKPKDE
jgi:hypothetical protein